MTTERKKLTVTDLINNKEQYTVKNDKKEELYIDRLGVDITIRQPEKSLCLEALEMAKDDEQVEKADVYIVYNIVTQPNLKDAELQKEFGCVEPMDIVSKIFENGEITEIAKVGLELAGFFSGVQKVKHLKN